MGSRRRNSWMLALVVPLSLMGCGDADDHPTRDGSPPATGDVGRINDAEADSGPAEAAPFEASAPGADAAHADVAPAHLPTFEHLEAVVDNVRRGTDAWLHVIHVREQGGEPTFTHRGYADTSERRDFWPASTVKVYTAVATLEFLLAEGLSLDATATFHHKGASGWSRDLEKSVRDIVTGALVCSDNADYTLLLRLVGVDDLNTRFFRPEKGFAATALMAGYDSSRPSTYRLQESQRIEFADGLKTYTREHKWSGVSYADRVGCTVYNGGGTGNCTTPRDLAEHLRRVMYHERLPANERYAVREADLRWLRDDLLSQKEKCGGPTWRAVAKVFPDADFHHKGGSVSDYKLAISHIGDRATGTSYIAALATQSADYGALERISEEVARMMRTPDAYLRLDNLADGVNPIAATGLAYARASTRARLMEKPMTGGGYDLSGWTAVPGTELSLPSGVSRPTFRSLCRHASETIRIRANVDTGGGVSAWSDLHSVEVDGSLSCP